MISLWDCLNIPTFHKFSFFQQQLFKNEVFFCHFYLIKSHIYLEKALKSLKNHKARDIHGHVYEIFKFGGKDLKASLLTLFNLIKQKHIYPSISCKSTIMSIWNRKSSQRDLENDWGIFNFPKIRSILDKIIYNDIYCEVDKNMKIQNLKIRNMKIRNLKMQEVIHRYIPMNIKYLIGIYLWIKNTSKVYTYE